MGIRPRNTNVSPRSMLWTGTTPHNKVLCAPPESLQAVAQTQAFSTLAANHPNRGLTNSVLLNGTGTCAVIDRDGVDRDVQLPVPWFIFINPGNGAFTPTIRITGIDNTGVPRVDIGTKAAGPGYYTGKYAWSVVNTVEFLELGGATGTDVVLIGYAWQGTGSVRPLIVPWDVQNRVTDIGGAVIHKGGGASGGSLGTDGTAVAVAQTAGAEIVDVLASQSGRKNAANFLITNPNTTAPTATILYSVFPRGTAYLRY